MQVISARPRDLGGFSVRRLLPSVGRKLVGPCIFFDHMGPALFQPGQGLDVRPHPHIGLATVTFLFRGAIMHRDSLGSEQVIRPGDVNWMTAGSGIVHSERTPPDERAAGSPLEGIQLWVALPKEHEETAPSFVHHPGRTLPVFDVDGVRVQLMIGGVFGHRSPVRTHSDMVYAEASIPEGARLVVPEEGRELGVYVVHGGVRVGDAPLAAFELGVAPRGRALHVTAEGGPARVMLVGGAPFGEGREIWWNFVSSSKERIARAKADWAAGRFGVVPGDEQEWIPLPEDSPTPRQPPGTIL